MSNALATIKMLKSSPLYSVFMAMYGQIKQQESANELYSRIIVLLDELLAKGYSFKSPEIQVLVEMLKELPAMGARQRNFERRYLQDEYTLRDLPKDPRRLSRGYWH